MLSRLFAACAQSAIRLHKYCSTCQHSNGNGRPYHLPHNECTSASSTLTIHCINIYWTFLCQCKQLLKIGNPNCWCTHTHAHMHTHAYTHAHAHAYTRTHTHMRGKTAESTEVLALLLQVGLLQVRIPVTAMEGKNV